MTLTCARCTAAYAVGLRACPQCGSEQILREDNAMPKITVAAGPTDPDTDLTEAAGPVPDADDSDTGSDEQKKGGESSSPGTSSSTSSAKASTKSEPNETADPSRARTTASRSKKGRTGGSSADSTGGGPTPPDAA